MTRTRLLLIGTLCLLGAARAAYGTPPAQDAAPERQEIERLEAWPVLEAKLARTVSKDIARLRKAHTEGMGEQARVALVEVGAGIVPELLPKLGKERSAEARKRIEQVLAAVTGAAHTRLLAHEFADRSVEVRSWAMRRAAAFPDTGIRDQALAALAAARTLEEKGKAQADETYVAALVVSSAGSLEGFDVLLVKAQERWSKHAAELRPALEAIRGEPATARVLELLEGAPDERTLACLRMLAGCGAKSALARMRRFLDSEHSQIRIAAINACRGIVDGEPPIDKLSAFDAIEMAREWKRRL